MLRVEMLSCLDKKFHHKCEWVNARINYPDTQYILLKERLVKEVKNTKTAYRITHTRFGLLCTIKSGHDGSLYIGEHEDALQRFAIAPVENF